ncbi:MAG: hypothetical protein CFE32_20840, partial [Alphaproteobacteria bacterium PA3]
MPRIFAGIAAMLCAGTALAGGPVAAEKAAVAPAPAPIAAPLSERRLEDEIIYIVLPDRFANGDTRNDRGGLKGGAFDHGFDPAHKGFYHGGDLKGL